MANPQKDQVADFSNYMNKNKPAASKQNSAISEKPTGKRLTKRIKIMIAILLILAVAQILILYYSRPPSMKAPTPNPESFQSQQ